MLTKWNSIRKLFIQAKTFKEIKEPAKDILRKIIKTYKSLDVLIEKKKMLLEEE